MSSIDGREVKNPETTEQLPNPEDARSPEEFRDSLKANGEHITEEMRVDGDWNDRASELADNYSPDELKEKLNNIGNLDEYAQKYENAVFGEYKTDAEKQDAIESASDEWLSAIEKSEVYKMALDKLDVGSEVDFSEDSGVTVEELGEEREEVSDLVNSIEPPTIPSNDDFTGGVESETVDRYKGVERGGREMSIEDKEAYGVTSEIEQFVKTGKDYEVKLPSQLDNAESERKNETSEIFEKSSNDDIKDSESDGYSRWEKVKALGGMVAVCVSAGLDIDNNKVSIKDGDTYYIEEAPAPIDSGEMADNIRDLVSDAANRSEQRKKKEEEES